MLITNRSSLVFRYSFCPHQQVWEMLLLGKLGWDVSGVTAFDFVDHLMERLEQPSKDRRESAVALRGHALTYVSLCCTGKHSIFSHSPSQVTVMFCCLRSVCVYTPFSI